MKDNFHAFGVACQRFIHTVINNFLTKMVRTSGEMCIRDSPTTPQSLTSPYPASMASIFCANGAIKAAMSRC